MCIAILENSMEVFKKLKIEPPYDPVILLLKRTEIRDIYTPMFTAALFRVTKTQKQPP